MSRPASGEGGGLVGRKGLPELEGSGGGAGPAASGFERPLVDLAADGPLQRRQGLAQLRLDLGDLDLDLEDLPLGREDRRDSRRCWLS